MIDGAMQDYALTLDKFLLHAAKWHPDTEVVTAREAGGIDRIGYAALAERARRVSGALHGLGIEHGDRVATLAWNTQEHMEAWYGIMAMGAVCHTLNPRLTSEQLAWMIDQSSAKRILASEDWAQLAQTIVCFKQLPLDVRTIFADVVGRKIDGSFWREAGIKAASRRRVEWA